MKELSVGKVLNIEYDTKTKEMKLTLSITDEDFKKLILRDMSLKDKITIKGDDVMWVASPKEE